MSNLYLRAAFEADGLTTAEKSILVSMADRANDDGYCYPSLKDLARRSSCTTRTVTNAIKTLENRGFLLINRLEGYVNRYILTLEKSASTLEINEKKLSTASKPFPQTIEQVSVVPLKQTAENLQDFLDPLETTSNKPSINHQLTIKTKHTPIANHNRDYLLTAKTVCFVWEKMGLIFCDPSNPDLIALVETNTPLQEFEFAAQLAQDRGKGFGYALGVVKSRAAEQVHASSINNFGVDYATSRPYRHTSRLEHSRQVGAHLDALISQEIAANMVVSHV